MIKGKYGNYDGNHWEEVCQQCMKIKYQKDGYQELPACQGDLGIEGFTRNGTVIQCYCPDEDYAPKEMYEKQRDKVTTDLQKLINNKYIPKLKDYLNGIIIKEWLFLTPIIKQKELIKHCHDKEIEFQKLKFDHISPNIKILAYDEDFFKRELEQLIGYSNKLSLCADIPETEIQKWQSTNNKLVERAIRKNRNRININQPGVNTKINKLTDTTIHDFVEYERILQNMKSLTPERYEKFQQLVSVTERHIEDMCMSNENSNVTLFQNVTKLLKEKIVENFKEFDEDTCDRLTNGVVADWIFRCPIEFEWKD